MAQILATVFAEYFRNTVRTCYRFHRMGNKNCRLENVKKEHEAEWKNLEDQAEILFQSLTPTRRRFDIKTIVCSLEQVQTQFNNVAEAWTRSWNLLPPVRHDLIKGIGTMCLSAMKLQSINPVTSTEVDHISESQVFKDGSLKTGIQFLLSYNVFFRDESKEVKIRYAASMKIFQTSLSLPDCVNAVPNWTEKIALETSAGDVSSNRTSALITQPASAASSSYYPSSTTSSRSSKQLVRSSYCSNTSTSSSQSSKQLVRSSCCSNSSTGSSQSSKQSESLIPK